jgi:hypothetical protein
LTIARSFWFRALFYQKEKRKMIRKILALILLIAGCSGYDSAADSDSEEFGTADQEITAASSPSFGYGATTGSSHAACVTGSTGQACLVPDSKTIRFCVEPTGLTTAQVGSIRTQAGAAATLLSHGTGWTFVNLASSVNCFTTANADVEINAANTGLCSGTTGDTIDPYVCVNPTVGAALSESLPGNYNTSEGGIIHIDLVDLHTKAAAMAISDNTMIKRGIAHSFAILMGLGSRNDLSASEETRRQLFPIVTMGDLTAGEKCRANAYVPGGTSFTYNASCPD